MLAPRSAMIVHTGQASLACPGVSSSSMVGVLVALGLFFVGMILLLYAWMWRRTRLEFRLSTDVCTLEHNSPGPVNHLEPAQRSCLMAGLEHVIPTLGIKVSAGGLGNVAGLYVEHLPVQGKFVFAMITGPDYSEFQDAGFAIELEDEDERCEVLTYKPDGGRVEFVALRHPMFTARTKTEIYPDGRKVVHFMKFMSLWNRCVAYLLSRYRKTNEVQLFHSLDYHAVRVRVRVSGQG